MYYKQLRQVYLQTNNKSPPQRALKSVEPSRISPLLPPAEVGDTAQARSNTQIDPLLEPPLIERPRSAFHTGDFTSDHVQTNTSAAESPGGLKYHQGLSQAGPLGTSPTTPWYTPPSSFPNLGVPFGFKSQETPDDAVDRRPWRSRAPSLNSYYSSSYVLKPPTTPLIQQSNNADLDLSPRDRSNSPEKSNRRRTLPPHAFQNISSGNQWSNPSVAARHSPSYRRESSFPYGHQPRRSLTSNWSLQASSSPQTPPYLRPRRTSVNSEASPLQHASMVGSYEESILRGWMSTAPSRPLDFTAQIGVLGKGSCKPKCPPHLTIPFPAVYYSWKAGNGKNAMSDDPSPYVGHIDLQRRRDTPASEGTNNPEAEKITESPMDFGLENAAISPRNRKSKKSQHGSSSSGPPGGSYRIPRQGQLQVIIKNPNKTAVKLFLVPYDLEGMEPGTKTFIRQRSFSAESVIDSPSVQKSSLDPSSLSNKPTLRYLIHLNICSPSKGHFYLYHQIRVVFANRVPDNKQQLRNEIQVPQPRYSAYRPNRESLSGPSSTTGAKLATDRVYGRRDSGFGFGPGLLDSPSAQNLGAGSTFPVLHKFVPPVPAIPFDVSLSRQKPIEPNRGDDFDAMELDTSRPTTSDGARSPFSDKANRLIGVQLSSSYKSNSSQGSEGYNKLNKGESGYGGVFGRPGTPEPGEGLIARRLRGLGVQRSSKDEEEGA